MTGRAPATRTAAIGVVVPVHDEEVLVGSALAALEVAVKHPGLAGVACRTVIVLDGCRDGSTDIARCWARRLGGTEPVHEVMVVECAASVVGAARRAGCAALVRAWGEIDPRRIWLATTDADSEVPPEWLYRQLTRHEEGVDLWTGPVAVRDWSSRSAGTAARWRAQYDAERVPIHGASMGINAEAYLRAGGFRAVPTGEDRLLHRAAVAAGAVAHHDRSVPVVTSSRREGRAPLGFASALGSIEQGLHALSSVGVASPDRGGEPA